MTPPADSTGRRVLAVDLGGTRIKAAVVVAGTVEGEVSVVPAPRDARSALDVIRRQCAELLAGAPPAGVGLAVPGLVGLDGRVEDLPGKYDGIVGLDLRTWSARTLGAPAVVRNDAVAYGLGEARRGAGRGARRVLVVTIGTGVGVGVIDDGQPISAGPHGGGIMGGNVPLTEDAAQLTDTAGRAGTIEAHCRAVRIVDYAAAAGGDYPDVPTVLAAYDAGDAAAVAGVETYRKWLARALGVLAVAHGADRVVVGGGPVRPGSPLLDGVEAYVQRLTWPTHHLSVVTAALGDTAALVGIADVAIEAA
jgi:glucokinase